MTAPSETSGAAPARCSGPSPARAQGDLLAALERERAIPGPAEHIAGAPPAYAPISPRQAAQNLADLAATLREADTRRRWNGRPNPTPTSRTSLQSAQPAAPYGGSALTSTNGQEVA